MKTALVVDDSPSIRMLVCHTLVEAGFSVLEGGNGKEGLQKLDRSEVGKKLKPEQRQGLLEKHALLSTPELKVGSEQELLECLDKIPLPTWKMMCSALPQRFDELILEAIKILEPQAARITLPAATLKTAQDVDAWLAQAKQAILDQLKNGPVII